MKTINPTAPEGRDPPAHLLNLRTQLATAVAARPGTALPLRTCNADERTECENDDCRRRGQCLGRFL